MFAEYGYKAIVDTTLRPWEWPDGMTNVRVSALAQAKAYRALLEAFVARPWFVGGYVWRYYANPMDSSQEEAWASLRAVATESTCCASSTMRRWRGAPTGSLAGGGNGRASHLDGCARGDQRTLHPSALTRDRGTHRGRTARRRRRLSLRPTTPRATGAAVASRGCARGRSRRGAPRGVRSARRRRATAEARRRAPPPRDGRSGCLGAELRWRGAP